MILKPKDVILLLKLKIQPYILSDTRLRIAKGAFWGTFGTIISRTIAIFLSFLLARILGKDGFGEYGIINNTAVTISGFAGLGLGLTVTRYVANLKIRDPQRAGKIIGLSSIITWFSAVLYGVLFVFFSPWLARTTLAAPHLAPLLQISSIAIGLGVVNSVQVSTLTGLESFKASSITNAILGIIQSLLVVIFAWIAGVKGAIIALSLCSGITIFAYYIVSRKELFNANIKVTYRHVFNEWKVLVKYSLPAFLSTISVGPVVWISNALLANQTNGYGELGIFNAALQWDTFLKFFPSIVSTAILPIMSDMYGRCDYVGSINIMWKMMKVTSLIVIPLAIIISILSPLIMSAYGESFVNGYWVVVIVVATTIFSSISSNLGTFIISSGKMWIGFGINFIWGLVFIALSYFMVRFGAEGLASAKFFAYILHFILSLIICYRLNKKIKLQV